MFDKLIAKIKQLTEQPAFDPSQFGDAVASQTDWTPLKRGGSNFKTHKLKKVHAQRMEFRCSIGMLLFGGVFFLSGVGMLIGAVVMYFNRGPDTNGT